MIFCFGDSWTAKWQQWSPWPEVLSKKYAIPTKNFASAGNSNQQILDSVADATLDYAEEIVDHVVVAFTSVDRITASIVNNVELCVACDYQGSWYKRLQEKVFEDASVHSLLYNTRLKLHAITALVSQTWNCDITFVPVFEDCDYWHKRKFPPSLMNICHYEQHGRYFLYDAPVYEVGVLQTVNKFGTEWCEKHLGKDYERAYFERTEYCTESDWFDDTLHPTQCGHDAIAKYFLEKLLTFK